MHLIEIYQSLQTIQKEISVPFEAYPEIHKSKKSLLHLPTYLTFSYLHSFDFLLFSFPIRYNF